MVTMDLFFKTFALFLFLLLCKEGECLSFLPVKATVIVCRGKTATLEVRITSGDPNAVYVSWQKNGKEIVNGEHYGKGPSAKYLNVYNALPVHTGRYIIVLKRKSDDLILDFNSIYLKVQDVYVKVVSQTPLRVMRKMSTTLKVEKSQLGSLSWRHNGIPVDDRDPHYTFLTPSKTELEIFNAQPEHEGSYEAVLKHGKCEWREIIDLEIIEMILSVNPVADVCVGGKASFEIKKNGPLPGEIFWTFSHRYLPKNEHYKESADKTVLDINNALLIHAGKYTVIVVEEMKWLMGSTSFDLVVRDIYLQIPMKNPVLARLGGNAILKVDKSTLGTLTWKHNGNLLSGDEPHYAYVNPKRTELEISNAGPEQAGVYEVFIKEGGCEKREKIKVQTGDIKIRPISSHSDICVGEKASFAVKVNNYFDGLDYQVVWRYNMLTKIQENEHFSLKADKTTLDVHNALPSHSGNYTAFAFVMQNGSPVESLLSSTSFVLRVRDIYLKALVRSPLLVQFGNNAILKVEKSELGSLAWKHSGNLLSGHEPHYSYLNPRKTELEISNAGPKQAGVYEIFLKEGGCEKREEIKVQTGDIKTRPISSHSDICAGEKASFAVEVHNYFDDLDFQVIWRYNMIAEVQENEHFSLKANNAALDVRNALSSHSGNYTAFAVLMQNGSPVESVLSFASFDLKVRDLYLKALVRSPLIVQFGNNAILKVEKSVLGTLVWKHNGNLLSGHEPHYAYVNPRKTELEISSAGPKQAGVYEVLLKEGGCEKREEIQVQTGDIKIRPISAHSDICVGEKASFAVEVHNYFDDLDFQVIWRYNMIAEVQENEHFSLKADNTTLDVLNALPSHSGNYTAFAVVMQNGSRVESVLSFTSFDLRVRDLYLKALVRRPLLLQFGNNAILKVEKSVLGTLFWKHNGNPLSGDEPHHTFVNPQKTELEISNAGPKQAGVYAVFLKEGGCEKRKEIQVQTGDIKIRPISAHSDICVGEKASFAVEVNNYFGDLDFQVIWRYNMIAEVQENEHFSLKADNTVLNVHNALPSHSGNYTAFAFPMQNGSRVESVLSFTSFDLRVRDLYLKALVRSPLVVQFGNNAILKVEKSVLGTLVWKHNGNLLSGHDRHYAYVNPRKTNLEISNAGPKQAGVYEVFLKEGGCEKREEIQVQTGDIKIRPIRSHSDICVGEKASFAVEVNNYFDDPLNFQVFWRYNMLTEVEENEHFSLKANNTALDVHDALPSHSGNYTAFAFPMQNGSRVESVLSFTSFDLRVRDVFLNASIESPIKIKAGDSAIFKVEKSDPGALFWTHDEELVDDKNPHFTLNANKTELEIVAARLEQAGIYEIVLKEGGCEISKVFEVQIYVEELTKDVSVLVKESKDSEDSDDSEFWAITYMILVYAKALRGFLFYKWYIAPAAGGGLLIVVIVLVSRFGRLGKKKKRPKKNAETHSKAEKGPRSLHVVLKNPVVTLLKEVIYTSADQRYPAFADNLTTNTCVGKDNQIQSPSLDHYGEGFHYGGITLAHDSLVGPTVPPPTQAFLETETSSDGNDTNYDSCD